MVTRPPRRPCRRCRRAPPRARRVSQPRGVAVGDEADVVAVGLPGDEEAALGGLLADPRLLGVAEGEERAGELVGVEHAEHVALVLGRVDRPVQLAAAVGGLDDLGVVPGGDGVEAERHGLVEQGGELDLLVAAQARVGGAAGGILTREVLDDVAREAGRHVPHVERDAEHVGHPARVTGVLDGAAAARRLAQRRRALAEGEVHADDLVPGVEHAGSGHRRVDAAAHRRDDPHQSALAIRPPPLRRHDAVASWARRARSIAAGRAVDDRVDVGGGRGVPEGEAQRAPGVALGDPHGEQHVARLGHAGLARRARSSTRPRRRRAGRAASRRRTRARAGGRCRAGGGSCRRAPRSRSGGCRRPGRRPAR